VAAKAKSEVIESRGDGGEKVCVNGKIAAGRIIRHTIVYGHQNSRDARSEDCC